jgi:hypothetical protein
MRFADSGMPANGRRRPRSCRSQRPSTEALMTARRCRHPLRVHHRTNGSRYSGVSALVPTPAPRGHVIQQLALLVRRLPPEPLCRLLRQSAHRW